MEASPKLPMLYFELKISSGHPDFAAPFKRVSTFSVFGLVFCATRLIVLSSLGKFIRDVYQDDPDSYDREIKELEMLRMVSVSLGFLLSSTKHSLYIERLSGS